MIWMAQKCATKQPWSSRSGPSLIEGKILKPISIPELVAGINESAAHAAVLTMRH